MVFHGVEITDWVHPFIDVSSDCIADDINEAIGWIKQYLGAPLPIKGITVFDEVIEKFEAKLPKIVSSYQAKGWI